MLCLLFKRTKSEAEPGFLLQRQSAEFEPVSGNQVLESTKLWRSGGCRAKQELVAQNYRYTELSPAEVQQCLRLSQYCTCYSTYQVVTLQWLPDHLQLESASAAA